MPTHTRADVARRAGVSPAVVSYVINGGPRNVAAATRARVLEAIGELNYTPNAVARSLRASRTRTVGLVIPDVSNAFFAQLAREIEVASFAQDATILLGNAMDDESREEHYLRTFIERRVDGLIVAPIGSHPSWVDSLLHARMPTVIIDRDATSTTASTVVVDNFHGAYLATRHLLEHGRRQVAAVAGPREVASASERHRGWAQAMREAGLDTDGMAVHVPFSREAGYLAALELFGSPSRPDAAFLSSDEHAVGVYRALYELGIGIPHDVAITSFDSSFGAPYMTPPLTAVHQPAADIAARAVSVLLEIQEDRDRAPTRDVLPVDLETRRSCGCNS